MTARKNWLAVVSAEHAARGRAGGFIQVCHGKAGPLRRIHAGDGIVVYAPTLAYRGKDKCQSFVSIGVASDARVYAFDMGGGFAPHRRNVAYDLAAHPAAIAPLLHDLDMSRGKQNWGYILRFGLIEISEHDFERIRLAMASAAPIARPPSAIQQSLAR